MIGKSTITYLSEKHNSAPNTRVAVSYAVDSYNKILESVKQKEENDKRKANEKNKENNYTLRELIPEDKAVETIVIREELER